MRQTKNHRTLAPDTGNQQRLKLLYILLCAINDCIVNELELTTQGKK